MSGCLSFCFSLFLSVCLSVYLSVYLSVSLSVYLSVSCLLLLLFAYSIYLYTSFCISFFNCSKCHDLFTSPISSSFCCPSLYIINTHSWEWMGSSLPVSTTTTETIDLETRRWKWSGAGAAVWENPLKFLQGSFFTGTVPRQVSVLIRVAVTSQYRYESVGIKGSIAWPTF